MEGRKGGGGERERERKERRKTERKERDRSNHSDELGLPRSQRTLMIEYG